MIRINLLPTKAAQKKTTVIQQLVVGVAVVVLFVGWCWTVNHSVKKQIDNQQNTINELNAQIKQLEVVIQQVEAFKVKKRELNRKIDTIKKLNEQRSGPVKLMEDFTYVVPRKAWITVFRETGKQVTLEGQATDGPTVADFVDNLRSSKFFLGVQLIQVQQTEGGVGKPVRFSINCRANYTPGIGGA
jgi:type IV pilus assembly protein PilN